MELSASNDAGGICRDITSILIDEAIDDDKEPDEALLQSATLDSLCAFQHNLSRMTDWDWDNSMHGMAVFTSALQPGREEYLSAICLHLGKCGVAACLNRAEEASTRLEGASKAIIYKYAKQCLACGEEWRNTEHFESNTVCPGCRREVCDAKTHPYDSYCSASCYHTHNW